VKTWIPDSRNFAYLNWKQVDALPRASTLLVLPTAAIEQHGHHLPLATDTLINNLLLGHALAKIPPELPVYALPPVHYGKSNEHIGFPGTLSVSASTFMAVLRDLGSSIRSAGFQKLVLYNTHGGNTSLVDVMARDLRAEFGLRTFALHGSGGASFEGLDPQERSYGFHAGEVETSFLLAAMSKLVDSSAYTSNYIADIDKPELLRPENAPAIFAWLTRDIAPSGVLGDPRGASSEKGCRWIEEAATRLASALEAMFHYGPDVQADMEPDSQSDIGRDIKSGIRADSTK
jgi:creatinine amidohydrolase